MSEAKVYAHGARARGTVAYRLLDSGSDTIIEAQAPDLGGVLVEIARAFTQITTSGDVVRSKEEAVIELRSPGDAARLLVAFVDELVFLFATRGFLTAEGDLSVTLGTGTGHVTGRLRGERYDPAKHRLGTEIKAATLHGARLERGPDGAHATVLVDL